LARLVANCSPATKCVEPDPAGRAELKAVLVSNDPVENIISRN
jgi:hypothetical protein